MNNDFGIHELDELLKEKINIEQIVFPTVNQQIINHVGIEYIFENGEKFEGRMENNIMKLGIYTWPNGQQYKGDFSENNNLRKGEIIFFPSNNKLTGIYNENREAFERCIYETDSYIYEGNIKRNKFHGNSSIQSKENENYSLKGKYDEGKRKGKFEIINEKDGNKFKINGFYRYGKKNGNFKVYNLENNELIFDYNFINDIIQLNGRNNFTEIRKNISINCIEILNKENRLILLLGAENKIFLYNITEQRNLSEIRFSNRCNILDILVLRDNNILVCNDKNKFNLIDIKINRNCINAEIIAEFKGKDNSSNIFSLREFRNDLIVSGDCNNLIFWKKDLSNRNNNVIQNNNNANNNINNNVINENNQIEIENNVNNDDFNIIDSIRNMFYNCIESFDNFLNRENNNEILYYSFNEINHIPLTHTYSFLEIKEKERDDTNIIIAVAQPDNESVIIYDISYINNNINIITHREIKEINSLINRKNIMTYMDGILYIGCKDSIKLIKFNNINDIQIINNILVGNISYLCKYRNKFLLCGINKNKSEYNFESKLIQYEKKGIENDIIPVCENNKHTHNGSIINNIIFYDNTEEYIVSLGTDKKIMISHEHYILREENNRENLSFEIQPNNNLYSHPRIMLIEE